MEGVVCKITNSWLKVMLSQRVYCIGWFVLNWTEQKGCWWTMYRSYLRILLKNFENLESRSGVEAWGRLIQEENGRVHQYLISNTGTFALTPWHTPYERPSNPRISTSEEQIGEGKTKTEFYKICKYDEPHLLILRFLFIPFLTDLEEQER